MIVLAPMRCVVTSIEDGRHFGRRIAGVRRLEARLVGRPLILMQVVVRFADCRQNRLEHALILDEALILTLARSEHGHRQETYVGRRQHRGILCPGQNILRLIHPMAELVGELMEDQRYVIRCEKVVEKLLDLGLRGNHLQLSDCSLVRMKFQGESRFQS